MGHFRNRLTDSQTHPQTHRLTDRMQYIYSCLVAAKNFCKCSLNTHPTILSHMLQKKSMNLTSPTPEFFHFAKFFNIYEGTHPIFCTLSYLKLWFHGIISVSFIQYNFCLLKQAYKLVCWSVRASVCVCVSVCKLTSTFFYKHNQKVRLRKYFESER